MRRTSGGTMAAVVLCAGAVLAACTPTATRQGAPVAAAPVAAAVPAPPQLSEPEVLAAAAPQTAGARRLSGAEYRRLVFGNTLVRQTAGGGTMMVHVAADGSQTLRLTNATGQSGTDRGRQTVRADRVCSVWERIEPGRETCFAYFVRGGSLVAVDLAGRFTPFEYELRRGGMPAL